MSLLEHWWSTENSVFVWNILRVWICVSSTCVRIQTNGVPVLLYVVLILEYCTRSMKYSSTPYSACSTGIRRFRNICFWHSFSFVFMFFSLSRKNSADFFLQFSSIYLSIWKLLQFSLNFFNLLQFASDVWFCREELDESYSSFAVESSWLHDRAHQLSCICFIHNTLYLQQVAPATSSTSFRQRPSGFRPVMLLSLP